MDDSLGSIAKVKRRRTGLFIRHLVPWSILILSLVALLAGLRAAPKSLVLLVDTPESDAYLDLFRTLEYNATSPYRWSYTNAAIQLHAFARTPVIVDLRLTSPRPADEPPADLALARGRWRTQAFAVRGDWRRYSVLIPATGYQPELSFVGTTFRPDERDRRSLGVALSRMRISIPATQSNMLAALAMLGMWRTMLILLLPLAIYTIIAGVLPHRRWAIGLAGTLAMAGIGMGWWQASKPITTALMPPEPWLPLLLLVLISSAWLAQRPRLISVEQKLIALLNRDPTRLLIILGIGLLAGAAMVVDMPPWEHPDESSHFEFAWLIANHPTWPVPGTTDPRIAWINGGGRALYHQPLYHATVSLVLRLVSGADVLTQLYVARSISLLLFLGLLFFAERTCYELFEPGHVLRWLAPLAIALNPTIANLMTGVNNDVASATVCSWAIWGAARILMHGLTWQRVIWLISAIPLAIYCKNTGAALVGIVPLVLAAAFWKQHGLRWRWLMLMGSAGLVVVLLLTLRWSDPQHWYRWGNTTQSVAVRVERSEAPVGPHALRLQSVAVPDFEGLSSPIKGDGELAGKQVTVGAWVWASRPAQIWSPGVVTQVRERPLGAGFHQIQVDTTPRFVAFQYDIPQRLMFAHLMAWSVAPEDSAPLEIYVDGLVMAEGQYPGDIPPEFDGAGAQRGTWGGIPFTNLVRNGDVEQGWFYLDPAADRLISRFARRSLSRLVASGADISTTLRLELSDYLPWMTFTSFGAYGGRIFLRDPGWQIVIPGMALLITCGVLIGLWRIRRQPPQRQIAFIVFGLICLGVWGGILIAHLPVNFPGGLPSARYGFTAIIPTTIVYCAGWLALWPRRYQRLAAGILLAGLLLLSIAGLTTIRLFDTTACAFDPVRCAFTPVRPTFLTIFR